MMKTKLSLIAMILCFSLLFGACSSNENEKPNSTTNSGEETPPNKLDVLRPVAYSNVNGLSLEPGSTISIIGRYSDDSYWKEVEAGAKQAVEDLNKQLGYKGNEKIKLIYSAPEVRDDVNEQVNLLDEELSRYPAAIGIATIDSSACTIQFDLAAEDGIPIVTFDSGSKYQHIASHVATDNYAASKTAADKLADAMEDTGEVAVFVQDSVSTTANDRLQGFMDTIKEKHPNISVVNVYHMDQLETMQKTIADEKNAALIEGEDPIDPTSLNQEDVLTYIINKYPNLKGIYATNLDTTQLVADVLENIERKDLKFIGFDGGEEQMRLVKEGKLEGVIVQNPYGMGYATVVAAARVTMGLGNESFVDTGYTWVTKDNMNSISVKSLLY